MMMQTAATRWRIFKAVMMGRSFSLIKCMVLIAATTARGAELDGIQQLIVSVAPGLHKGEHDGRAPAGVFQIGKIFTYDQALPAGANYPFRTVTPADAWIDDV